MAEELLPENVCSNAEHPDECCGSIFPAKQNSGLCAKCAKLVAATTAEEREIIGALPQCKGCSAVIKFLVGVYCGLCKLKYEGSAGSTSNSSAAQSVSSTQSRSQNHADHIKALTAQRLNKRQEINEFLLLRFLKNVTPEPNSMLGTLGEFYDIHHSLPLQQRTDAFKLPQGLSFKTIYIFLNAIILVDEFEKKTGVSAPEFVLPEKTQAKRKKDDTLAGGITKKSKVSAMRSQASFRPALTSNFRPSGSLEDIEIMFSSIDISKEGNVTFTHPQVDDPGLETIKCQLGVAAIAKGTSQKVYKGLIDEKTYAFKRFYNVGSGKDSVTINENKDEVSNEAARLARTAFCLSEFLKHAEDEKVDVDRDISVTEYRIAVEVPQRDRGPSRASGYTEAELDSASEPVMWLVEPFRHNRSEKWSGTNEHPLHDNSKLGNTLNTLAHYIYWASSGSMVIADIQSCKTLVGGKMSQVLFDLTTHTVAENSGVGDHGQDGLDLFIKQHECTTRCEALGLQPLMVDDNSEEDE
ncbi:Kinase-like protein [Mycena kentingensis (nom. inval.)]|nr:Kinase-like protein [Mycena kentingensis (nom. inval.)]